MKREELSHPRVFEDDEWADVYYKHNAQNIKRIGKLLAKQLKKSGFSEGNILDVGCGFASIPIELANAFPNAKITGIDLSEPLLKLGQTLVTEAGLKDRIELLKGDAQKIQFENNSFDVVINTFLLHIVEKPEQMLNEIERVAKPDAKIMITDLRRGFLALVIKKFRKSFTSLEAVEIIEKSDLRKGKLTNGPFWWDYMVL